jgi:glycosyltransferase involved in cell wall biosynthesis
MSILLKVKPIRILLLSRYSQLGASSRLRFCQYFPYLNAQSISVEMAPLFSEEYLRFFYNNGRKSAVQVIRAYLNRLFVCAKISRYDLVWIEKECFPWLPSAFEQYPFLRETPYIVDYDDAVHHNYDQHPSFIVKRCLSEKFRGLLSGATTVTVGNTYLAEWARNTGAALVEEIPTVIDLTRYPHPIRKLKKRAEFRVGWIGTPATVKHLWFARDALVRFAKEVPVRLVVVGAGNLADFGLPLEQHEWAESSEVSILSTMDAGIMPLPDSPWEWGKCGYKLIQYMASGLPVIASSIGANAEIVNHGVNGYLADTPEQWYAALKALQMNAGLRDQMGMAGRRSVELKYCRQVTEQKLVNILMRAASNVKKDK